jgi:hypothetical protein
MEASRGVGGHKSECDASALSSHTRRTRGQVQNLPRWHTATAEASNENGSINGGSVPSASVMCGR